MNDKELQKIIDTKNGTISVLKDTVKKWVREYNMLDACIELQNEKINAYKMSENEANEIIAELKAYKDVNEDFKTAWEELKAENERLKSENETYDREQYYYYNLSEEYKQALQEIKEIAESCMNKDTCYDCKYCDDCYIEDAEMPTYDICKLLIQKITKAEEE